MTTTEEIAEQSEGVAKWERRGQWRQTGDEELGWIKRKRRKKAQTTVKG